MTAGILTMHRTIPADWTDYNGHMNEARYLQAFSDASDRLMTLVGVDAAYIAAGQSCFTAETHIRHLGEASAGDEIVVTTRVLLAEGKRLHLWHEIYVANALIATGEQMLIHVDLATRRARAPTPEVVARLNELAANHGALPLPEGIGRFVGQRP